MTEGRAVTLDELVVLAQRSRRQLLCEPHRVPEIQAAVNAEGLEHLLTVSASPLCPPGQLILLNTAALEAWAVGEIEAIRFP